jgi:hypothetical protein
VPPDRRQNHSASAVRDSVSVELSAVVVAVTGDEPKVLAIRSPTGAPDALPSGPLEPQHRTLELGLRDWVESQTRQALGYAEQLYTFGDRDRQLAGKGARARMLSIGYLTLVREARAVDSSTAVWRDWYRYFPWEDWRGGRPKVLGPITAQLRKWVAVAADPTERKARDARARLAFGLAGSSWNDERVLERYELLYEVGLVPEAHRDRQPTWARARDVFREGEAMIGDHRRILATAIARLRGKIKYRPVVFELMPPSFPMLHFQRTVEALAGVRLHKPNFRRLVESQGLVEETGELTTQTGGRPARLVRFRREVLLERPAPGVTLPIAKR